MELLSSHKEHADHPEQFKSSTVIYCRNTGISQNTKHQEACECWNGIGIRVLTEYFLSLLFFFSYFLHCL